jgi:hypothetical protein
MPVRSVAANGTAASRSLRCQFACDGTVGWTGASEPSHVTPDAPVFLSTTGNRIEPKSFSEH